MCVPSYKMVSNLKSWWPASIRRHHAPKACTLTRLSYTPVAGLCRLSRMILPSRSVRFGFRPLGVAFRPYRMSSTRSAAQVQMVRMGAAWAIHD